MCLHTQGLCHYSAHTTRFVFAQTLTHRSFKRPHVNQLWVILAAEKRQQISSINTKKKVFFALSQTHIQSYTHMYTHTRPYPLHLQLKGHCSSNTLPPLSLFLSFSPSLSLCFSLTHTLSGSCFVDALFTQGLGLSTYTPPFSHFPGSLVSFGDAGRPSPATLQTQLTEGCSRATPQGPNSPFECVEGRGLWRKWGFVCIRRVFAIQPVSPWCHECLFIFSCSALLQTSKQTQGVI